MAGGAVTIACTLTMRAVPSWCTNSPATNFLLSQFPAGLRGEGLGLRLGRNKCFWRVPHGEKKGGSNWRLPELSCALGSDGKDSAPSAPKKAIGIPVLDRDEKGNVVIRTARVGESISFGPIGNGGPSFMPSSTRSSSSNPSRPLSTSSSPNTSKQSQSSAKAPSTSNVKPREDAAKGGDRTRPKAVKSSSSPTSKETTTNPRRGSPAAVKSPSSPTSKETTTNLRRGGPAAKAPSGPPQYSKAARRFYNEKFREPERLAKVLAAAGVASRRASEAIVFEGRVSVNGKVCTVPQTPVDPLKDIIYVDGNSLPKKMATKMYFALNKPKGYICSSVEEGMKPVLSLFDDYFKVWAQRNPGLSRPRMFTVGRLDVATSGLLLVTNDGEFANKVSHPSSGLTKEYIVTVNDKVTRRQLAAIGEGTLVQGVKCVPTLVEPMDMEPGETRQRIKIVVSEGRNHEVRHLVEDAGLQVLALKRVRIGGFRLSRKLGIGKFDELTEAQIAKVLDKNLQAIV
ncbi:23S rRNA pseudouridine2605 synthase [Marchantia polymorpha subsp. ruderalis]|uniref:RNA-binding S4 domain-containing protein n=2 Tax=Marchantia polymorpha TaxID=3197 RepID=A0A176VVI9_MARPO|nr:hypothetical protein AXG93_522s1040 [Marchantia polymorpha subsp. ruderalis]PTQ49492.1 hypothetical protein MARPO_0002s0007 [Marchantia polymorpha]BBN00391.1 hypothetical protein Mp_1g28730 [Marchantia polymorpha subsp. ruderalis]|eukprot:PTQ49492.1 hypothetical protein MARPO_0002s0007 [Marchantia polymorpha]